MALPANCNQLKKNPGLNDYCCLDTSQTDFQCTQNFTCDATTAKCVKGPNYCAGDADCQGGTGSDAKYKGLTCVSGTCKCTNTGYLCTDTTVCVASSGPPPSPPTTAWPSNFSPSLPPDKMTTMWTNKCSDSQWFTTAGGTCPPNTEYVGGQPTDGSKPQCVLAADWKKDEPTPWDGYTKLCYYPPTPA